MSAYVALPRVPESGEAPVGGAALRRILLYIGFRKVQVLDDGSGAAFEAEDNNRRKMEAEISFEIRHETGSTLGVILLTREELAAIAASHPLAGSGEETNLYVTVLSHEPAREDVETLLGTMNGVDEHAVAGKAIYSRYGAGYRSSRRSNEFFEKLLGIQASTRTWSDMGRLLELSSASADTRLIQGG